MLILLPPILACRGNDVVKIETGSTSLLAAGDFHLNNSPPMLVTTAVGKPNATIEIIELEGIDDPSTYVDGGPRPNTDGTADYAGPDVP